MTLAIERARSRKPITVLTVIGVLLLPVIIGAILVAALYNPVERLDSMNVAVVNNDEPVTIDEQYVPLGRQLTAGLVEGSDDLPSNLTWTISNDEDAAAGIAAGTYAAVVTIPSNFSAAATSTAPGGTPERATIAVSTAPDALIVDEAITAQVTQAAAGIMGTQLSEVYLENVFLGFTTLGEQLGEAAGGAGELATGAQTAASGATELAAGIRSLSSGAGELATGATGIATGASGLASGATQLSNGAAAAATGVDALASGAGALSTGATELSGALTMAAGMAAAAPSMPPALAADANALAGSSAEVSGSVQAAADQIAALAATCAEQGGSAEFCASLSAASAQASGAASSAGSLGGQAADIAQQAGAMAMLTPQLIGMLQASAGGATQLAGGLTELSRGATQAAAGVRQLSGGASQLSSGASQLASGAGSFSSGASQLASGATEAAEGTDSLAAGVTQLADGNTTLAQGLTTASEAIPSYSDSEAADLASIVANPVEADGLGTNLFGVSAIPLLAMLALWFGGLASFVAFRAVSSHVLTSRRSSALLTLRSLAPALAVGAVQGILVAVVVQLAASYSWAQFGVFALLSVVAGMAFAAVNQALIAVFGGAGRWIAALVGVLAVATGVVSTVPGALASLTAFVPTTPVYNAMLASLTDAGGVGAGIVGMLVWAGLAFLATTIAVARRRSTTARALLAAPA